MKKLDIYIIRKFLGTFFFSLALIILIAVIFDITEKIDEFIDRRAPLGAIIFDYYMNFIPYFANLFSPLFVFIAVIYFTSRMTFNSEIIAILSSGVSFRRMLVPYFISAFILAVMSFYLTNFVIPPANKSRLEFEERYVRTRYINRDMNIHKQIAPGEFIYMESYNTRSNIGYKFSIEKFENKQLKMKLMSDFIRWDTILNKWRISNYYIRHIDSLGEKLETGKSIDTLLAISPDDFQRRFEYVETMNYFQLDKFIQDLIDQGADTVDRYLIEKYRRLASPFATFILTLIGVTLSIRKSKGGIGLHIGFGLLLSFSYILFMQISTQFAINGSTSPLMAVWIPNILFSFVGVILYLRAPK